MKILYIKDLKLNSHKIGCSTYFSLWKNTIINHRERVNKDFIYALSADETSPALAAPRHAITSLFSCRFKCPCPPRRQRHFHGNADRAYNTLHFASKVVCQRVTLWKPCFVGVCSHTSCKTQNKRLQSAVKITAGLTAYFVSARQFSLSYPWVYYIKIMLNTGWNINA